MRSNVLPIVFASALLLDGCSSLRVFPHADETAAHVPQVQTGQQQRNQRILNDADGLIRAGSADKARVLLERIDKQQLEPRQKAQFNLLDAQIELSEGDPEHAMERLQIIDARELSLEDQRTLHQSRAFAYELTGRLLDAAKERVELAQSLTDPKQQQDNQIAIFDALHQLSATELQSNQNDTFGGWMALALLFKQNPPHSVRFNAALQQWQKIYPEHPADLQLLRHYSAKLPADYPLRNIAVLLPESGQLAQAAQAVKAGMQAAERVTAGEKPTLRFYDSESAPIGILYRQAVNDGAGLVIGPLEKEKLKQLANTGQLNVPVLALNDVPGLSQPNLYQFSLNPSEEAGQVATKAWADGRRKALILAPDSERGKRVAQGYADAWHKNGGTILKTAYYGTQSGALPQALEKLLNLQESAARFRQIGEIVPGVQFTPRSRDDMDAVLIDADPGSARTLNQQLRKFETNNPAVYATPLVYSSTADPAQDAALDGISFCDMPWFFPGAYRDTIDAAALQAPWKTQPVMYSRLLAMGIDAYRLSSRLPQLGKEIHHGATGNLARLPDGRIARHLYCAKFASGIAQPVGFADIPAASATTGNVEKTAGPAVP